MSKQPTKKILNKKDYIDAIQQKFEKAKVVVLAKAEGLSVDQMNTLRKNVRASGDETRVVKNTLAQRALKTVHHEALSPFLTGSTMIMFGYSDPVVPVKALFDFAGKAKNFEFKAGMLGDKLLTVRDLDALSKLPGRPQLLSMMLSVMQGPMRNMVGVLQGTIRKFVYAVNAIKEKKEKAV